MMNSPYQQAMPQQPWPGLQPMHAHAFQAAAPSAYPGFLAAPGQPHTNAPFAPMMGMTAPTMPTTSATSSVNGLSNPRFIKGALIGAAVAYLLTNEQVQQATIRGLVRVWSLAQGGIEEMKERFRDAEAELHAAQAMDSE